MSEVKLNGRECKSLRGCKALGLGFASVETNLSVNRQEQGPEPRRGLELDGVWQVGPLGAVLGRQDNIILIKNHKRIRNSATATSSRLFCLQLDGYPSRRLLSLAPASSPKNGDCWRMCAASQPGNASSFACSRIVALVKEMVRECYWLVWPRDSVPHRTFGLCRIWWVFLSLDCQRTHT
jgi:hypothetical protein